LEFYNIFSHRQGLILGSLGHSTFFALGAFPRYMVASCNSLGVQNLPIYFYLPDKSDCVFEEKRAIKFGVEAI